MPERIDERFSSKAKGKDLLVDEVKLHPTPPEKALIVKEIKDGYNPGNFVLDANLKLKGGTEVAEIGIDVNRFLVMLRINEQTSLTTPQLNAFMLQAFNTLDTIYRRPAAII